ncbi:hypothetical protein GTW43_28055 [Streptomyces sp. SID5785]|nr:hypothetical protein [Streptomyces sp. SID5785]
MTSEHVRRSYSFVCLDCGHGWESTYEIDVSVDDHGRIRAAYALDGRATPSLLQAPRCANCEGRRVRILRPGRVAGVRPFER